MGENSAIPSSQRVETGSVNIPLGEFPASSTSSTVDAPKVAQGLIDSFNDALLQEDSKGPAIGKLFLKDGSYLRDHLAFSWVLRTIKGSDNIIQHLTSSATPLTKIEIDSSSAFKAPRYAPIDAWGDVKGIQFFHTFETTIGRGAGVVRLAEENGEWKIFTISIVLKELKGYEEPVSKRRPMGIQHGDHLDRKNWQEVRDSEFNFEGSEPRVLIVGAGQGGLIAAARLKMLNIPSLVIDTNERVGDNWRRRYHQLVLHDPVWFDHMPYVPFPVSWPVFTPKDKLAEWFESYVKVLDLNVWTQTSLKSTAWDDTKQEWTVEIERKKVDGTTEIRTFHPRHIIQATGHSGKINFPSIKGIDDFKGTRLCHSSEFTSGNIDSKGKKAIVVGGCNSGHDIAHNFYDRGYDVTMVQRSTTCVISSEATTEIGLKGLYDEDGPPVEDADFFVQGMPSTLFKAQQVKLTKKQNEFDKKILDGLERVGFGLDKGPNDAGLLFKYFQRGGGYYIDVGASQLIIDGKIKIKHGVEIEQVLPDGLQFADGTKLEADEIVFATGYQNMRSQARLIFGDEVADKAGDVWGFNEEGELRTMWQRSGHPGLWFMGGNFALSRYYSRLLALQIKAVEEGLLE